MNVLKLVAGWRVEWWDYLLNCREPQSRTDWLGHAGKESLSNKTSDFALSYQEKGIRSSAYSLSVSWPTKCSLYEKQWPSDREERESHFFPHMFPLELPKKGILQTLCRKLRMYKEFSYSPGSLKKQSSPKMPWVREPTFKVFLTNAVHVHFTNQNHSCYSTAQRDNVTGEDNVLQGYLPSYLGTFTPSAKTLKLS